MACTIPGTSPTVATPPVTYAYDLDFKGAVSSLANALSTTSFTHDALGRIATSFQTTSGASPYQFQYGYSLTDGLISIHYPSGRLVPYALDEADRVHSIQNSNTSGTYATGLITRHIVPNRNG